ncbi:MAG: zinc ribbon domain-containing protein [Alphaproteobacteria bacterium]|mgnify:FL=1|jgi:uncharacterized OB-fold protein|nr:zinc ribbon domain-containing protein [Alphaproteobacteria bacterium]
MIRHESINIPFKYAAGQAGSAVLLALRDEGRILAARCTACDRVSAPARAFCPACGSAQVETVEVGPGGELLAWTDRPGKGMFGLIKLDGAASAMLHRLLCSPAEAVIGSRFRAHFAGERRGHILDIEGFVPEDGS